MKIPSILIALVLTFCAYAWLRHTENVDVFLDASLPAGQRFYLASKLLALLALGCLVLQLVLMLCSRYSPFRPIRWSLRSHRWFGIVTFSLIAAHSVSFITAVSLRNGTPAYSLLLPNFNSGLYNAAVSFGLLAFYLCITVVVLALFSGNRSFKFKLIHRWLVWIVVLCVLLHSIAIGSESKTWLMVLFYGLSLVVVAWLVYRRYSARKPTS